MFTVSGDAQEPKDPQPGVDLGVLAKSLTDLADGLSKLAGQPEDPPVTAPGPGRRAAATDAPVSGPVSGAGPVAAAAAEKVAPGPVGALPVVHGVPVVPGPPGVPGPTVGPPAARRGRRWALLRLVAGFLVLGLVVAALVSVGLRVGHDDAVSSARTSGLAAARAYALDIATYDYKTLDQDFGRVTGHATPTFKQKFDQSSAALRDLLVKYQAHATGNVLAAGVESASTSRVVAVLFVDQTVTNTNDKQPAVNRNRLEVTVEHHGGRWQIADVKLL
jgi:Mce-associated membrane protein